MVHDFDFDDDSTCLAEGYFRLAQTNSKNKINFASIFPNPAKDEVVLRYATTENSLFKLTDLNGRLLLAKDIAAGIIDTKIPVKVLNPGFYIWELKSGNYQNKGKLIISR